jgi:biopolymer transport protein ExbB/TolQ
MWKLMVAASLLLLSVEPAMAYIGPGIGVGMIATVLGILTAIVLAIFAVFWYPVKRLLKRHSQPKIKTTAEQSRR